MRGLDHGKLWGLLKGPRRSVQWREALWDIAVKCYYLNISHGVRAGPFFHLGPASTSLCFLLGISEPSPLRSGAVVPSSPQRDNYQRREPRCCERSAAGQKKPVSQMPWRRRAPPGPRPQTRFQSMAWWLTFGPWSKQIKKSTFRGKTVWEQTAVWKPGSGLSPETKPCWTLTCSFQLPEPWEVHLACLSHQSAIFCYGSPGGLIRSSLMFFISLVWAGHPYTVPHKLLGMC